MSTSPDIHVDPPAEAPSVGALVLALDGSILEADAAAARLLGARSSQELRGLRWSAQLGAEQRDALRLLLDEVFAGSAEALELFLSGLDGDARRFQVHACPVRDGDGAVRAAQLTLHDVTERRRAEEALADRAQAFRTLAESLSDNVVLYDRQCRAAYVNPTMRTGSAADIVPVLGLTPSEQSPGVPWARLYQQRLEEVLTTGRAIEMEGPIRTPTGEMRMDQVVITPVRTGDGEVARAIAIGRDVTRRKASEDSLRQLSLAVEQSPASIVITNTGGRIEYVNAKFTEVTGYSAAEVLGQNPRILKSGETPPEVYREMWQAITSGRVWRGEFHNRRKNGELYWEVATISPVFGEDGRITHFLGVKEDVTERKRLEEGLRQAHRMDAIRRPVGGVAHDLDNLLTVIQSGAATLREGGLGQDQGNELLDQISEAAERAVRIWLPLLEGTVPARPPPTTARPRGGDETVLVVEDDLSVQRMAQRILEQAGYRVHVASSAAGALDIWAEQRGWIDLVLTSLVMPGMGGRELAERLRAESPSLRVVYTTGYSREALDGAAALRDVLEKPYRPEEILARIRACLDGS